MTAPRLTADGLDLEIAEMQILVEHARLQVGDIDRDGLQRHDVFTVDAVLAMLRVVSERLEAIGYQLTDNMPALRDALPDEPRSGAEPDGDPSPA